MTRRSTQVRRARKEAADRNWQWSHAEDPDADQTDRDVPLDEYRGMDDLQNNLKDFRG